MSKTTERESTAGAMLHLDCLDRITSICPISFDILFSLPIITKNKQTDELRVFNIQF